MLRKERYLLLIHVGYDENMPGNFEKAKPNDASCPEDELPLRLTPSILRYNPIQMHADVWNGTL